MQIKQSDKQDSNAFSGHRNAFEQAITESHLSPNQRLIALILKKHMNNSTGLCNPSIKTLMRETGLKTKNTVKNCIDALERAGFITRIVGNGRGNSTRYTLNIVKSDVDSRNKHRGNTQNLQPNYSYESNVDPNDFPQVDFHDESQSNRRVCEGMQSHADTRSTDLYQDHLERLEPSHRASADRSLTVYGYYFNEHYRKYLDADGRQVVIDDF